MPFLFLAGLSSIALGSLLVLVLGAGRFAVRAFAMLIVAGCAALAASALAVLAGGASWQVGIATAVPGGAWILGADALSAFFLLAIAVVGAASAVYGMTYLAGTRGARAEGFAHAMVGLLIVALALVVVARAAVPFLIAWEVMAVAAFLLVMTEHEHAEVRRAGLLYLAATHTATLALIGMFAAWGAAARDLTFVSLAAAAPAPRAGQAVLLLLALFGFGVKAGIVPLHFWLPSAHASAPSHVSALMSGLVIKTGIYGLLRTLALLGGAPAWFGWLLFAAGLTSGVLGVVWALAQHDLKRLLAYHSVENIGIILIGIGVGVLGAAQGVPVVAALGYTGAILHVLNHALFKGLLFLGAGAVAKATGTRALDALGGLARRMPATATLFLLGSAAIVGLPPLNGFVSEWTIVRALLESGRAAGPARAVIVGLAGIGLIGGLALACFAKVNGAVFLGRARTAAAQTAREGAWPLVVPMAVLAAACVTIGLLPFAAVPLALAATRELVGAPSGAAEAAVTSGLVTLTILALTLAAVVGLAWLVRAVLMRGRWRATARTWACGYPEATARMQYTASSFAAPLLQSFGAAAGVRPVREGATFHTVAVDPALAVVILPAWRQVRRAADTLRALQLGRLHVYLLYVLATVIALLAYLALWRSP